LADFPFERLRGVAAAAIVVAALALVSAAITFPHSWSWATDQRNSFEGLASPTLVFKYQQLFPEDAVAFAQARMQPKDRYYVLAREGSLFAGVDYPTAVRTFTRYALLPAVQVPDPHAADFIIGVGADPGTLGLKYSKVDWDRKAGVAVAKVAR
jgi:hypothetical protein